MTDTIYSTTLTWRLSITVAKTKSGEIRFRVMAAELSVIFLVAMRGSELSNQLERVLPIEANMIETLIRYNKQSLFVLPQYRIHELMLISF